MKKIKIALFYPWIKSRGGGERLVLEYLKKSRHEIDIYTWVYLPKRTYDDFLKYNVKVIGPKLFEKEADSFLKRGLFGFISSIFSKIPLKKYDVFFVITGGISELITFRNRINKGTFFYTLTPLRAVHDSYECTKKKMNNFSKLLFVVSAKVYRMFEKLAYKNADYVFTLSKLVKDRIVSGKLCVSEKISVVYPGVDYDNFKTGKYENYLFYPSRINESKQQNIVLDAFKMFEKNYASYRLTLAGSSRDDAYLKKIKNSSSGHNVEILVDVSDKKLKGLYSNCLATLFYPKEEDWGLVPFEAMASGKFVLGINEGGYTELFKNKQNGLLTNPNPEEISKAMKWIVKNRKKVIAIGKCNRKTSINFDWKFFAKNLDNAVGDKIIINSKIKTKQN